MDLDDLPGTAPQRDGLATLIRSAREIVLPGTSATPRVPAPSTAGAADEWYDVTTDCVDLTDGIPAYGSC